MGTYKRECRVWHGVGVKTRGGETAQAGGRAVLSRAATRLLTPLLRGQATKAIRRAPRLTDPAGPAYGVVGEGDPYRRLLVIGESTAAGIGASRHTCALPGFLAAEITGRRGGTVAWTARGKSGVTARRVITELLPLEPGPFDFTLLTVGINDLLDRRPPEVWGTDLRLLIEALRDAHGHTRVIVSGMPPVHRVPAIPQPLRFVAGRRAATMNRITRRVSAASGATYVAVRGYRGRGRELFASDGFHPSEIGYRVWARALAPALAE
jgi:lysophospholipase L1-like esterase